MTVEILQNLPGRWGVGSRPSVHPSLGRQLISRGLAAEVLPDGKLRRRRGRPKKQPKNDPETIAEG